MGVVTCCQFKQNHQNLGQVTVDIKSDKILDQFGNTESKIGQNLENIINSIIKDKNDNNNNEDNNENDIT